MAQFRAELADDAAGIGAAAVAFVDECDAGDLVALHLLVHRDGLGLDAADRAEHEDGAVEHPERTFHLDGEIHMAGRVDDVDLMVLPFAEGGRRGNGDAALLFQLHGIHGRADAVLALDFVNGMDALGVVENPLGQRGLARVDVGADPDVSGFLNVVFHDAFPFASKNKKIPHLE